MVDATIILGIACSGLFFGLLVYAAVTAVINVRSWIVVVGCVALATVVSAAIVWNFIGYRNIVS